MPLCASAAAICTDSGAPFASKSAFFGLSKLSVWGLRLGIAIERIKPGKSAAERSPRAHASDDEEGSDQATGEELLQQQSKFDRFIECYNESDRTRRST